MPEPRPHDSVRWVLGPTNTGKTHLAVERMLGHSSGVIGLPLRLLAREIYDRVTRIRDKSEVALVTGEEKIVPRHARYWIATTEAMPLDVNAAFVAVDEIQLCADSDRGHVFTDRLLNARGREETMFMGAETMRELAEKLLPRATIITRPRFSSLTHVPPQKLSRLPRRSAVIAFSATEVYGLAEMLRRQRGGAAVVMGALSPRTRNAQVALYQNGDVDYIVATDAIGMGLNMDIDHVAFASRRKFDGQQFRELRAQEVAQIAGRAGRHMSDGTFSTVAELAPDFDSELVAAVEQHRFPPVEILEWRNSALDFSTPDNLVATLEAMPRHGSFRRAREAEDLSVLKIALGNGEIRAKANAPAALRRLWDACQIPDFRKVSPADHARLCLSVFRFLMSAESRVPADWFDNQLKPLDRVDGDIDTLAQRIAHVRTWTYAANRPDWLRHPERWQDRTREIEDRLSDALHERLSQRFIDRRTAVLMRELRQKDRLMTVVEKDGSVSVEGHFIGSLEGFAFAADQAQAGADSRTLRQAAEKALAQEITARAERLAAAEDKAFSLLFGEPITATRILWEGVAIGELAAGPEPLRPRARALPSPLLTGEDLQRVEERLQRWLDAYLDRELKPLFRLKAALDEPESIKGLARGLAYQLYENLGTLPRRRVAAEFRAVDKDGRRQMRSLGIWLGAASFYLPPLLKPLPARLRLLLWAVHGGHHSLPQPPQPGLITITTEQGVPASFYEILGFRPIGGLAIRLDMLERLGQAAREASEKGAFALDARLMSLVGVSGDEFLKVMSYLGYNYRAPTEAEAAAWLKRQAERPAEPASSDKAAEEPAEADGIETPQGGAGQQPVNDPANQAPEPTPVETDAQIASEPEAEAQPEIVAEPNPGAESEKDAATPEAATAVPEKLFFREEVRRKPVRPKSRPRRRTGTPDAAKADGAAAPAGDEKSEFRKARSPRPKNRQGERRAAPPGGKGRSGRPAREPEFDADSPFAALAALRQAMLKK